MLIIWFFPGSSLYKLSGYVVAIYYVIDAMDDYPIRSVWRLKRQRSLRSDRHITQRTLQSMWEEIIRKVWRNDTGGNDGHVFFGFSSFLLRQTVGNLRGAMTTNQAIRNGNTCNRWECSVFPKLSNTSYLSPSLLLFQVDMTSFTGKAHETFGKISTCMIDFTNLI